MAMVHGWWSNHVARCELHSLEFDRIVKQSDYSDFDDFDLPYGNPNVFKLPNGCYVNLVSYNINGYDDCDIDKQYIGEYDEDNIETVDIRTINFDVVEYNKTKLGKQKMMIYKGQLPDQCVTDCSASGPVDEAVEFWIKQPSVKSIFKRIPVDEMRRCLKTYGVWNEEELKDDEQNKQRILWLACGTFNDRNKNPKLEGSDVFVIE